MGEAHLAGPRIRPAADQPRVRDGVVRRPERPARDERLSQRQNSGDRMNLGRLQRLVEAHLGEDRRKASRQHGLAGPRGTDQQDVMPARRRDLERPLGMRLPPHLREINVVLRPLGEQAREVHTRLGELGAGVEEIRDLGQVPRTEHADAGDDARFREVLPRQHQRLQLGCSGGERHGQRAAHRPDRALQPQLPQHRDPAQPLARDLLGGRKHAQRNGQIEGRTPLADVGGGQIDRDALQGERVARVRERGVHALAALLDGALRQPDGDERGEPVRDVGLDVHQIGVDPEDGGGAHPGEHTTTLGWLERTVVGKNARAGPKHCAMCCRPATN